MSYCRDSTPVNQYPKLPPAAAKTGYAQRDSRLKKGRISIPNCQKRTARPTKAERQLEMSKKKRVGEGTEAGPKKDFVDHCVSWYGESEFSRDPQGKDAICSRVSQL